MLNNKINGNKIDKDKEIDLLEQVENKDFNYRTKGQGNKSCKNEWMALSLTLASIIISFVQWRNQDYQTKQSIIKEYIDNISSLKFDRNLENGDNKTDKTREDIFDEVTKTKTQDIKLSVQEKINTLAVIDKENDKKETATNAKLIARAQTLAALRRLEDDGESKGFIILFLYESGLIKLSNPTADGLCKGSETTPILSLATANLKKVNLEDKSLCSINLKGTILRDAKLKNAILKEANLESADLKSADLRFADLRSADLRSANLTNSDLSGACYNDKTKIDSKFTQKMRKVKPDEDVNGFKCKSS